jgi:hypothetical protein
MDPFTAGFSLVDTLVKKFFPDAGEEDQRKLEAFKAALSSELAIHATNQAEAQHNSLFVAGWRPFIGWCGGAGVAYSFLIQPFGSWLAAVIDQPALPVLDTSVLMSLVMTMLGFGGYRTYEKMQGVSRNSWLPTMKGLFNGSKEEGKG